MSQFRYQSILLRRLKDKKGWEIIGIRPDCSQEVITILTREGGVEVDEDIIEIIVENFVNRYARHLTGKPFAKLD